MYYLDPATVTDATLLSCSLAAEDQTAAWAAGTYAVGDERHVAATHKVYRCAVAGSSAVSPPLDPTRWKELRPTNRWAPFDWYASTQAEDAGADLVYELSARYANALAVHNLAGSTARVQMFSGATQVYDSAAQSLQRPATGYWDYGFGERQRFDYLLFDGLPLLASARLRITIAAATGARRALGSLTFGKLLALHGTDWGGVQWGAEASPKSYSYRKTADDGTITYVPRGSGKDITADVVFPEERADAVVQALEGVIGKPLAWFSSLRPGFAGLSTFGFATRSPVRYAGPGHSSCSLTIEGIVSK